MYWTHSSALLPTVSSQPYESICTLILIDLCSLDIWSLPDSPWCQSLGKTCDPCESSVAVLCMHWSKCVSMLLFQGKMCVCFGGRGGLLLSQHTMHAYYICASVKVVSFLHWIWSSANTTKTINWVTSYQMEINLQTGCTYFIHSLSGWLGSDTLLLGADVGFLTGEMAQELDFQAQTKMGSMIHVINKNRLMKCICQVRSLWVFFSYWETELDIVSL